MPTTYEPIATATLNTTSFAFTSIPQTYTDLKLIINGVGTSAGSQVQLYVNNVTTAVYAWNGFRGSGASTQAINSINMSEIYATDTGVGFSTTIPSTSIMDIFSYTGSTFKTILQTLSADRNGNGSVGSFSWLYRQTTAISSLNFTVATGNFVGTATLYGIKAA